MKIPDPKIPADSVRVLVIDDDPSTRLMVREVLGPAGYVVEEADGGQRGLSLAESFRPDVVLLDILMPEMDGFETLRALRKQHHGSTCPVVMITGLQDPSAVESAYQLGATDFVTKPLNWSLLRLRINYVLRSSRERPSGDRETLEDALRLAGVGTWRWDPKTGRVEGSDRFRRMLRLRDGEPLFPKITFARIRRSDRRRVLRAIRQLMSANGETGFEMSFRTSAEGRAERCMRVRAEAFKSDGEGMGLAGILVDISETRRLERVVEGLRALLGNVEQVIQDPSDSTPVAAGNSSR